MPVDPFPIKTQTTEDDRDGILWTRDYVCRRQGEYVYLEIGSYRGGTIAPHIADPRCTAIYSIDKRVDVACPHPRCGKGVPYRNNTTKVMRDHLSAIHGADMSKLVTFDADASQVDIASIKHQPHLVLIDGEHTDEAVFSDWLFIEALVEKDMVVMFHDVEFVGRGVAEVHARWEELGWVQRTLWNTQTLGAWHILK